MIPNQPLIFTSPILLTWAIAPTFLLMVSACQPKPGKAEKATAVTQTVSPPIDSSTCHLEMPSRLVSNSPRQTIEIKAGAGSTAEMVWIHKGTFLMGTDDNQA